MANPSTGPGPARKVIADAIRAVKDEERLQEIEKRELSTTESVWIALADIPRMNWCTDYCVHPRLRFPATGVPKGTAFEVHVGERVPSGQNFRRATAEEIEASVPTRDDAARYAEARRPVRSADELLVSVEHERERAVADAEATARRVRDLDEAVLIAKARAGQARADFETFFEGKPEQFRVAVEALALRLEAPPAPAPAEELPRTLDEIARRVRADATPRAFASTAGGVKALPIGRGGL